MRMIHGIFPIRIYSVPYCLEESLQGAETRTKIFQLQESIVYYFSRVEYYFSRVILYVS